MFTCAYMTFLLLSAPGFQAASLAPGAVTAQSNSHVDEAKKLTPNAHERRLVKTLDRILAEYREAKAAKDVGRLVALDGELRELLRSHPPAERKRTHFHIERTRWRQIGVGVNAWSYNLCYTDKLLVEARRLDVDGAYRQYTMYSAIHGLGDGNGLGLMPNIGVAHRYIKEYPKGPFAFEAAEALGSFYCDLYSAINLVEQGKDFALTHCFREYIQDDDFEKQREVARKLSLHYLRMALELAPPGPRRRSFSKAYQQQRKVFTGERDGYRRYCGD